MPQGWMDPQEALAIDPDFFVKRGDNAWVMDPDGFGLSSRFGAVRIRVQTRPDGTPDFDRVAYTEAPAINAVVWGREFDNTIKVAVVSQARPFADLPDGTPADPPIVFGQPCIMGFLDKILGKELGSTFEEAGSAGIREAAEEAGALDVISVTSMHYHISQPTFATSWGTLLDIEVDLQRVTSQVDSAELIYKAEYLPLVEVVRRVAEWNVEECYRSAVANATLFTWLCRHPEGFAQIAKALQFNNENE